MTAAPRFNAGSFARSKGSHIPGDNHGFYTLKRTGDAEKGRARVCQQENCPHVAQWDKDHCFPYKEAIRPMGELGFWGTVIPEEYEGEDMGWLSAMIVG
jgi:alkylation response protein AidB-like acyl-CoA dehydrogenase